MGSNLDAPTLRRSMSLFAEALRQHRDEIDSLNVYPVPDGDTGSNMLLTQQAVEADLGRLDGAPTTFEALGTAIARASLIGARGNSGVILSQVLRGLAERLPPDGEAGPEQVAEALDHAAAEAVRAVARPAEGTVLTVLRDAARAAREAATSSADVGSLMETVLREARRSLERTRDLLPELREAGVVDAGGKGMVLLLDALHAAVRGAALSEPVGPFGPMGRRDGRAAPAPGVRDDDPDGDGPRLSGPDRAFEVQYLVEGADLDVASFREALDDIGDSLVIVGGGGLYSVHVHTDEPGRAVELALDAGRPRRISIVALADGAVACIAGQARAVRVAEQTCGLVAVAEGHGVARILRSLGAVVVRGGQGAEPPPDEMSAAIAAAPAGAVVVLPNDRRLVALAEDAAAAATKRVGVVPTRSVATGIAVATAFNPAQTLEENLRAMEAVAFQARAGEMTRVDGDVQTWEGKVPKGAWVGWAEGEVVAHGAAAADVAVALTESLGADGEILTLVVGSGVSRGEADRVAAALRGAFPEMEIEVVDGGQPRYPYLIGVE